MTIHHTNTADHQHAADVATLALTGALDLVEAAIINAANQRNWRVLALMMHARDTLVDMMERLQEGDNAS